MWMKMENNNGGLAWLAGWIRFSKEGKGNELFFTASFFKVQRFLLLFTSLTIIIVIVKSFQFTNKKLRNYYVLLTIIDDLINRQKICIHNTNHEYANSMRKKIFALLLYVAKAINGILLNTLIALFKQEKKSKRLTHKEHFSAGNNW